MKTCVIFNGPPNSGKDTLADLMVATAGFVKHQMKDQLYLDTAKIFNADLKELRFRATNRMLKETSWHSLMLGGKALSPREALIHTSEVVVKPVEGKDYYGKAVAQACVQQDSRYTVISDGGFAAEIEPLRAVFESVYVFRLHREGADFKKDSRSYYEGPNSFDIQIEEGNPGAALLFVLGILSQTL